MLCAEMLLSGLLYVNDKSLDLDLYNDIYIENGKSVYVIPDKISLEQNICKNEKLSEQVNKSKLKAYIKTIE